MSNIRSLFGQDGDEQDERRDDLRQTHEENTIADRRNELSLNYRRHQLSFHYATLFQRGSVDEIQQLRYSVLPPGHFRLVRFISVAAPMRCEIAVFPIEDAPDYFVISHSWGGDGENSRDTIICNGMYAGTGTHLYHGLYELGMKEQLQGAWFWIDALCINLDDQAERAVQARAMNSICSSARKVLIWLGPEAHDSNLVMGSLRGLTEIIRSASAGANSEDAIIARLPLQNDGIWRAIVRFYNRSWFRRLWTIQEVVLARDSIVCCADRSLKWSDVVEFSEAITAIWPPGFLNAFNWEMNGSVYGVKSCKEITTLKALFLAGDPSLLSTLLTVSRERDVNNPFDRVYSILGLVSDDLRDSIRVDYEWTPQECYLDFNKALIQREPTLTLLSLAEWTRSAPGFPSWSPDFNIRDPGKSIYSTFVGFKAGFDGEWDNRRKLIQVCEDGTTIKVPGFRVDTVNAVTQRQCYPVGTGGQAMGPYGTAARSLEWDAECLGLFHSANASVEGEIPDSYCRTLIANHFDADNPIPAAADLRQTYKDLKALWTSMQNHHFHGYRSHEELNSVRQYKNSLKLHVQRRFFTTSSGRIGLGPSDIRPGDILCVFYGGNPVYVLRPNEVGDKFRLVGDAFSHGLMDLQSMPQEGKGEDEVFLVE